MKRNHLAISNNSFNGSANELAFYRQLEIGVVCAPCQLGRYVSKGLNLIKGLYWKFALVFLLLALSGCGMFTSPDDIKIADPVRAVADARRIIEMQRTNHADYPVLLENDDLPQSLRLPGLRYATVYEDHLSLVLARNPDWRIGARIWSIDSKRKHADTPTKYAEVFFYRYNNDDPESPENIP